VLAAAVADLDLPVRRLVSGAGHDAAVMAAITPACMLFVRCAGGISHNPAEDVSGDDIAVALEVLDGFLRRLAAW
jgi:allantoate deiminase